MGRLRRRRQPDCLACLPATRSRRAARRPRGPAGRRSTCRLPTASGTLLGAVPMYLKSHSYGEYVFDWGWADAYERAGGRYYPKLLCAVPFTPVPGPRLLVRPDAPAKPGGHLIAGMVELRASARFPRCTSIFPTTGISRRLPKPDFCSASASNSIGRTTATAISTTTSPPSIRASARRSRRSGARPGRRVSRSSLLTGGDLEPERTGMRSIRFYLATSDRKWGSAYLNRKFFSLIGERMPDKIVLFMARRGKRIHRRRLQYPGPRHDLRPQLGRSRRIPIPAFRVLLLPGDRVRDRARLEARRGRRAGAAQNAARLSAGADLQRALDPRPRLSSRRRRNSSPASATWSSRRSSTSPNTRLSAMRRTSAQRTDYWLLRPYSARTRLRKLANPPAM